MENKVCKLCKKKLMKINHSGYCSICYKKSPYFLEYQRNFQREWYYEKGKVKKQEYRNKPKVRERLKKYQKKYQKEHIETMRIQKREWARKNRIKLKMLREK